MSSRQRGGHGAGRGVAKMPPIKNSPRPFYSPASEKETSSQILKEARASVTPVGSKRVPGVRQPPTGQRKPPAKKGGLFGDALTIQPLGQTRTHRDLNKLPVLGNNVKQTKTKNESRVLSSHAGTRSEDSPAMDNERRTELKTLLQKHIEKLSAMYRTEEMQSFGRRMRFKGVTTLKPSLSSQIQQVFQGRHDVDIPPTARIVRVFLSSTFTDTADERNALMQHVVPRLKIFCQEKGYELQLVDMRWGIRSEAANDHSTLDLCLREIHNCQKVSTGPTFVTLLSHKYGYQPLQPKVESAEFNTLLTGVDRKEDQQLLLKWYQEDENAIPATYILQPIRALLPDYNHSTNEQLRSKAETTWWETSTSLHTILMEAALKTLQTASAAHRYVCSITELEIEEGLLKSTTPNQQCLWFRRSISGLEVDNTRKDQSKMAAKFIDLDESGGINSESQALLQLLEEKRIPSKLMRDNIHNYQTSWGKNGFETKEKEEYVQQFCTDFEDSIKQMVTDAIARHAQSEVNDPLFEEVSQHSLFSQSRSKVFYGRQDTIREIESYLNGEVTQPLVIHGESGCGKTSVMAVAAQTASKMEGERAVILRFLGTTPDSTTIHRLLLSLCQQINRIYKDNSRVPETLQELREAFPAFLSKATAEQPLVVILDSLDQLDPQDGARQLGWLPKTLPPHVKMILSTLPDEKYGCFQQLQATIKDSGLFLQIPALQEDAVTHILSGWLQAAHRKLTPEQTHLVVQAFHTCPLPLFLKLAFDEACRWHSFSKPEETRLQTTVVSCIHALFERVEKDHGKLLVQHALGYITAAKSGLTESELEDVLSCDDEVLNDVFEWWVPPVRRLPAMLWVRIKTELAPYLVERGADGASVIFWYHRQFIETAKQRFLSSEDQSRKLHSNLADYFLGSWAGGKKKPFTSRKGKKGSADRHVAPQPLLYSTNKYNLRKLSELPHHLIHSANSQVLKKEVLCNLQWLDTKLRATSLRLVLDDFNAACRSPLTPDLQTDMDVQYVRETLQLSQEGLRFHPNQLPGQLLAHIKTDQDTCGILSQAGAPPTGSCLLPSRSFLTPPGGPLIHSMVGHTLQVMAVAMTQDSKFAVTGSLDNTLKIWDVTDGYMLHSIDDVPWDIEAMIQLFNNDQYIVTSSNDGIRVLRFETGEQVYFFEKPQEEEKDNYFIFGHGCILIAIGITVRVFDLNTGVELQQEEMGDQVARALVSPSQPLFCTHSAMHNMKHLMHPLMEGKRCSPEFQNLLENLRDIRRMIEHKSLFGITCKAHFFEIASSGAVKLYDINTGKETTIPAIEKWNQNKIENVHRAYFSPNGSFLILTFINLTMMLDLETGDYREVGNKQTLRRMATTQGTTLVSSGYEDFNINIWDLSRPSLLVEEPTTEILTIVPKNVNGKSLLTFVSDESEKGESVVVKIVDAETEEEQDSHPCSNLQLEKSDVKAVHVLSDDRLVIRAGERKRFSVVDMNTWEVVTPLQSNHSSCERHYAVVSNQTELISQGFMEKDLDICSLDSGEIVDNIVPGLEQRCYQMKTDKEGRVVLLQFLHPKGMLLQIWDVASRSLCMTVEPEGADAVTFRFGLSHAGTHLALGNTCKLTCGDITFINEGPCVLDIQRGKVVHFFPEGHIFLEFISDSRVVSTDVAQWHVWDVTTGSKQSVMSIPVHPMIADGLILSTVGDRVLASTGDKKTIAVYDMSTGTQLGSFTFEIMLKECVLLGGGDLVAARFDRKMVILKLHNNVK
ncbi:PREDICTED: NACHT domain- and WD repeat-containing protein 1-like [Branchiostoma belcheri]|uniref:NACHT domain- and WD repeat-containing protein 1-like n=1 Tax=Branchiostoma belcheri TaxID=7741 RepID=A0A6P4ZVI0_BRABE|nr:PREDICTED: NACHT domain- and WD repeat-containing protein 1-like [Branchiostoma belcheri]